MVPSYRDLEPMFNGILWSYFLLDGILGMTNGKIEYKTTNTFFIFCDQSKRPSRTPFGNVEIVGKICLPFKRRETYCFSLIFFFRFFRFFFFFFCFSAKLVWTITFQIGQWYLVCGCMTIRWCVAYRKTFVEPRPLTWRSNNCFLNSIFLSGP